VWRGAVRESEARRSAAMRGEASDLHPLALHPSNAVNPIFKSTIESRATSLEHLARLFEERRWALLGVQPVAKLV